MSLIDKVKESRTTERADAADLYKKLLLRNDTPEPGDVTKLRDVMAALGRTADDLEADAELAAELAALELADSQIEDLTAASGRATRTLREAEAKAETEREALKVKQDAALEPLRRARHQADSAHRAAATVIQQLSAVKGRWREISGEPAPLRAIDRHPEMRGPGGSVMGSDRPARATDDDAAAPAELQESDAKVAAST